MTLLDDFLFRAALAGVGVALATAPLGCFVVWRRMAYFGDATAHAAILGVAISLAFSFNILIGVLAISLIMGLTVTRMTEKGLSLDTGLGVMSHAALAIGLVAVSLWGGVQIDIESFLFGDIIAVGRSDLVVIWLGAAVVVSLMCWRWSALLTATLSSDLAYAAGISPRVASYTVSIALAIVVAVAIKVVGALLIGAMLVIPAASARVLSKTPEMMAVLGAVIGSFSAIGGVAIAAQFDTPAGPTIVCLAAGIFATCHLARAGIKG